MDMATKVEDEEMPLLPISSPQTIRKCAHLELVESDIFICSYPKSGTTWMQHIILSMILLANGDGKSFSHVSELAPFFEIDAHWEGNNLARWIQENQKTKLNDRRVFNTHLRFPMLPKNGTGGKFIYIVRSPLDACVSFYHHLSNQVEGGFEGSFDSFFDAWLDGKLAFGSWIDHIRSFQNAAKSVSSSQNSTRLPDGRHLLFVSYEQMVQDLNGVLKLLNDFLELALSNTQLDYILPEFSFEAMKNDIDRFQPRSVRWKNNFCFLRTGQVGGSSEIVNDAQNRRFLEKVRESGMVNNSNTFIDQWLRDTLVKY